MVTSSDSDPSLDPVRRVLEKAVERGAASGAVALIGGGDNAHVLSIGTKTLGAADPMRRDSIFRISSLTKPVTAAATMMLIEDGKFRLDEPVDDLLPELSRRQVLRNLASPLSDTVPAKRPITAEDLLTMRCGTHNHLTPAERSRALPILASNHGWGYGMSVVIDGTPEGVPSGSFGWNGGLGTSWVAVPRSDMSVILMTQTAFRSPDPPAIHKDFWRSVFHPPSGQDP